MGNRQYFSNKSSTFLKNRTEDLENTFVKNTIENSTNNNVFVKFPKNALIELSSICNHSCVFCTNPRMKRSSKLLSKKVYESFIMDAVSLGLEEVGFYTTGEPFVRNDLEYFVEFAMKSGIKYSYITTNGSLATIDRVKKLIEVGLSSIKFSINAGKKETYALIHGKDHFEKVIKNLSSIKKYRDDNNINLRIMASFIVTKFSENEKEEWKNIVLPLVDEAVIRNVTSQSGQSLEQLAELEIENTFEKVNNYKPCQMLWNRIHLTQEGYLTLCCVDYENSLAYADLSKESLLDAWNNQIIQMMRKKHLENNIENTLCYNCIYNKNETYNPISDINKSKEVDNTKGENSVKNRIEKLITIRKNK